MGIPNRIKKLSLVSAIAALLLSHTSIVVAETSSEKLYMRAKQASKNGDWQATSRRLYAYTWCKCETAGKRKDPGFCQTV